MMGIILVGYYRVWCYENDIGRFEMFQYDGCHVLLVLFNRHLSRGDTRGDSQQLAGAIKLINSRLTY